MTTGMTTTYRFTGTANWWQKYGMTVTSAVGTLFYAIMGYLGDNRIDGVEWFAFAVLTANGLLVWLVPVFPKYGWIKNAINGVLASLALGYQLLAVDHWDSSKILLVLWTFLVGAGVLASPAVSPKTGGISGGIGGIDR